MATGTVRWFDPTEGFVTPDGGGPDAFVHISALGRAGLTDLRDGDEVSCELVADKRSGKMSAEHIEVIRRRRYGLDCDDGAPGVGAVRDVIELQPEMR